MQCQHSAFYRFITIADPHAVVRQLKIAANGLLGSVLVAGEGINGTLAGAAHQLDGFERALTQDAAFEGLFTGIRFQRTDCQTAPFARLKIRVRPEIVDIGTPAFEAKGQGIDVSPADWDALIAEDDVVLLDNRNHFEFALGHFNGAQDPAVFNYRDFAAFVEQNLASWQLSGKRIAMYCTGGIRCEKTSQWLAAKGIESLQLQGGILNYLRQKQAAELSSAQANSPASVSKSWQGDCFVFDNRMALDSNLQEKTLDPEQVYTHENDEWRLNRARRLVSAVRDGFEGSAIHLVQHAEVSSETS